LSFILEGASANASGESTLGAQGAASSWVLTPERYGNAGPNDTIGLAVIGDVRRADLAEFGVAVNTLAGNVSTMNVPLYLVDRILQVDGVEQVIAASRLTPLTDASMDSIEAPDAWNGDIPPTYSSLRGSGIIVGIIDTGIDADHPDFRTQNDKTRIKYAWNQWNSDAPSPSGFSYGAEYTESMINAGQFDLTDTDGHGTHMAGVAAGNGRANSAYSGVAPDADLVIVKTMGLDVYILDAVAYVFQKAAILGKPAVVNVSFGTQKGGHDGTYWLDEGISALTGPGKIVTAPVGNYGDKKIHGALDVASGQSGSCNFIVPPYSPNGYSDMLRLEGWHDGGASFRFRMTSPGGYTSPWVNPGNEVIWSSNDGYCRIRNAMTTTSNGSKPMDIVFWPNAGNASMASGTWTITLSREPGTSTGKADFWLTEWNLSQTINWPEFTIPKYDVTIASPATADDVIATGGYITKARWTNYNGGGSAYASPRDEGKVLVYSAYGPRRDGALVPDVVAPGLAVAAAYSSDAYFDAWALIPGGTHIVKAGTSVANAHTTGAIALLLEEARLEGGSVPGPTDIRNDLMARASHDQYTGSSYGTQSGHGKLSLAAAAPVFTSVLPDDPTFDAPSPSFVFNPPFPNPMRSTTRFRFSLAPEDLTHGVSTPVEMRIFNAAGRLMTTLPGQAAPGMQEISWDGNLADGRRAPAGVYYTHLVAGTKNAVRKLVLLSR
jgi:subtilisin family serine protease